MKALFVLLTLFLTPQVKAIDSGCHAFPENTQEYRVQDSNKNLKSLTMSEDEFIAIIERFKKIMAPQIKREFDKDLTIQADWESARVNASATRDHNLNPVLKISGGLARHPLMGKNEIFLILCHELGHQFGGAPKKFRGRSQLRSWSSAEGQADYYASTSCMPYLLSELGVDSIDHFQTKNDELDGICHSQRCKFIALVAENLSKVFYDVGPKGERPSLDKIDKAVAYQTVYSHPSPQCRLDTFISGAQCEFQNAIKRFDDKDPEVGICDYHSSDPRSGARPVCWFNPNRF